MIYGDILRDYWERVC